MDDITASAYINLKEQPPTLYLQGEVLTYHDDDLIEVSKADPQGINESILVVDLLVNEGIGPRKGTRKEFSFQDAEGNVRRYTQVTIRYNEAKYDIQVDLLG